METERYAKIKDLVLTTVESMSKLGLNLNEYETFKELLDIQIKKVKVTYYKT